MSPPQEAPGTLTDCASRIQADARTHMPLLPPQYPATPHMRSIGTARNFGAYKPMNRSRPPGGPPKI